ncbi:hypothetical protein ACLOJK_020451 [Asimina triloba]
MAKFLLLCLIFAHALTTHAMLKESNSQSTSVPATMGLSPSDLPTASSSSRNDEAETESDAAEAPEIRRLGGHRHHQPLDKSIAAGGVIIGGLATFVVATVFCYIRATRRRNEQSAK